MDADRLLEILILGLVQGIAEFLPVSSSGHLVIVNALLAGEPHSETENLTLNVALHLATVGSIVTIYRGELKKVLFNPRMIFSLIIATIPLGIVGVTMKDYVEEAFSSPLVAAGGLYVTAVLLLLTDWIETSPDHSQQVPNNLQALGVGLFQALAIVPGISRSGSTIAGGIMTGVHREMAATFSFLIALPAILGASLLQILSADPTELARFPLAGNWAGNGGCLRSGGGLFELAFEARASAAVGLVCRLLLGGRHTRDGPDPQRPPRLTAAPIRKDARASEAESI